MQGGLGLVDRSYRPMFFEGGPGAAPRLQTIALTRFQRFGEKLFNLVGVRKEAPGLEYRAHRIEGLVCGPPIGGDCRQPRPTVHGIDETDDIAGTLPVEGFQARFTNRSLPQRGIDHVGQANIAGKIRAAVELARKVEPRHIIADQCNLGIGFQRNRIGQILLGGFYDHFAETQFPALRGDDAVRDRAAFPGHVPARRRSLCQQRPGGGPGFAIAFSKGGDIGGLGGDDEQVSRRDIAGEPAGDIIVGKRFIVPGQH